MSLRFDSNYSVALAVLAASLWTPQATAQTSVVPPASHAAAADAAPPFYRSALEGYLRYTDEKTVNWKDANDTVARIGGWRAYAKEASQTQETEGSAKPGSGAAPSKP